MGNRNLKWPASAAVLSAMALAACTTGPGPETRAAPPPQPEMPAKVRPSEIIGRWGYAAYHKPEDRARTEANARGQCKQPASPGPARSCRPPAPSPTARLHSRATSNCDSPSGISP